VQKIEFGDFDGSDGDFAIDDVIVYLSDGNAIVILDASADFVPGDAAPGFDDMANANPDDFVRTQASDPACNPTCEVPDVECPTIPEPVWYFV
jgi:hypothetical protein